MTQNIKKSETNWAMYCHAAAFAGAIIPGGNVIGPLVIWLMKKDEYALVDDQGKEVLNFQLTVLAALFISFILSFFFIGILLMGVVALTSIVFTVLGIVKTSEGLPFRYPFSYRFIK